MTDGIAITDALDAPELFGPLFADATWSHWRVFLKALFGLGVAMTSNELGIFRRHTGRTEPPLMPFREAALVCGRRGGKSRVLALIATYLATMQDYDAFLAPGEVPTVAIVAADRKQARVILG